MRKVIGWIRLLIGVYLLVAGVIQLISTTGNSFYPVGVQWLVTLTGAYFVLGSFKYFGMK